MWKCLPPFSSPFPTERERQSRREVVEASFLPKRPPASAQAWPQASSGPPAKCLSRLECTVREFSPKEQENARGFSSCQALLSFQSCSEKVFTIYRERRAKVGAESEPSPALPACLPAQAQEPGREARNAKCPPSPSLPTSPPACSLFCLPAHCLPKISQNVNAEMECLPRGVDSFLVRQNVIGGEVSPLLISLE